MAPLAWGSVKPEQLLATIVLLQLLNDTPQPSSDNLMSDVILAIEAPSVRTLTLRREKEITEVLAFLAASTDDPAKVAALCVEERQSGKAMVIRLAVNNGGLEKVKHGFQEIAKFLENIARKGCKPLKPQESDDKMLSSHQRQHKS